MSDLTPHMDAGAERMLEESLERRQRGLDRREQLGNLVLAAAFLAVALLTAVLGLVASHITPTHRAAAARALDKELPAKA